MRLFLGIEIPKKIQTDLFELLIDLRKQYPQFSWILPDRYHIAIYHFGETTKKKELIDRCSQLFFDQYEFSLHARSLQVFDSKTSLSLFVDFFREKQLEQIAFIINEDLGISRNKTEYSPHISIAKSRRSSKQQYFVLQKILSKSSVMFSVPVRQLVIMKEDQLEEGKGYNIVGKIPLIKKKRKEVEI